MNRLTTTKPQVIYVEDQPAQALARYPQQEMIIIRTVPPRRRRSLARRLPDLMLGWFVLGVGILVLLCFVVEDPGWVIRRGAAALVILLVAGGLLSIAVMAWDDLRAMFSVFFGGDYDNR